MEYSIYELLFFLFCYSFMGWCGEVVYMIVQTGRFCNRGFLNLPLSLSCGLAMDLLLLVMPTMEGAVLTPIIVCMVVTSACARLTDEVSVRLAGKKLREGEERSVYAGKLSGLFYTLMLGGAALVAYLLVHPVLFLFCKMIPQAVLKPMILLLLALLLLDFATVIYAVKKRPMPAGMQMVSAELEEQKRGFGNRLSGYIWSRLIKAYPNLKSEEEENAQEKTIFARGLCLDKIIWVFFISALGGDIIETFYVKLTADIWMSRSSVLYGTFSIVWGVGAALLTMLLYRLADREDRYVFLGGFFLGGVYEYMCSVFTEIFFGTTFWDYSDMPFNIGGRTNLLFCIFWGILAMVWIKICYPAVSRWIERIPPIAGKILTWICVALMACDILISALAMVRYVERASGLPAENAVDEFVDHQYPDALIEWVWPNLIMK